MFLRKVISGWLNGIIVFLIAFTIASYVHVVVVVVLWKVVRVWLICICIFHCIVFVFFILFVFGFVFVTWVCFSEQHVGSSNPLAGRGTTTRLPALTRLPR